MLLKSWKGFLTAVEVAMGMKNIKPGRSYRSYCIVALEVLLLIVASVCCSVSLADCIDRIVSLLSIYLIVALV